MSFPAGPEVLRLRSDAITWREIEDEVVLLDLKSSKYIALNGSGSILWKRLADGATRAELVRELVSVFGIDEGRATTDVDAFVSSCRKRELLDR
jgi:hypothetical protein